MAKEFRTFNKPDRENWGETGTYMTVPQLPIHHRVVQETGGGRQWPMLLAHKASLARTAWEVGAAFSSNKGGAELAGFTLHITEWLEY